MALPSTMTWASKPLAEDILLLDAAKKDSTGTRSRNTNGLLILDQIQIIVEIGGRSNDEVYTNSHRGLALRVIFCHVRNSGRSCHIRHEP